MLPLSHNIHSNRAQDKHIDQPRHHGSSQRNEGTTVLSGQKIRKTVYLAILAGRQRQNQWEA